MQFRLFAILHLATIVLSASSCRSFRSVEAALTDLAQLSPATIGAAQDEARMLLRSLCVELSWSGRSPGAPLLHVQILARPLTGIDETCLGFAVPRLGHAAIFVSRVQQANADYDHPLSLPVFIGCVIAHEIGHLLLRSSGHSDGGLMRASLGEKQLLAARQRRLSFTASDRKTFAAR